MTAKARGARSLGVTRGLLVDRVGAVSRIASRRRWRAARRRRLDQQGLGLVAVGRDLLEEGVDAGAHAGGGLVAGGRGRLGHGLRAVRAPSSNRARMHSSLLAKCS